VSKRKDALPPESLVSDFTTVWDVVRELRAHARDRVDSDLHGLIDRLDRQLTKAQRNAYSLTSGRADRVSGRR
jgi:hypothetical protein